MPRRVGAGQVRPRQGTEHTMQTRWTDRYAQRTRMMRSSMVRDLLKLTAQPDVISFAGGLPGADLFPLDQFREACRRVLEHHGAEALQYSTEVLRDALAEKVAFVPGAAFFADGSGQNTMRLNFTNASTERIEDGIGRLGRVLSRLLESDNTTVP